MIKAVTMMTKSPPIAEDQKVSGGQTQKVIDKNMSRILAKYQGMFKGIGLAKVAPIHMEGEKGTRPVTQRQKRMARYGSAGWWRTRCRMQSPWRRSNRARGGQAADEFGR